MRHAGITADKAFRLENLEHALTLPGAWHRDLRLVPHLRVADARDHVADRIVDCHRALLPARLHEARNQALRSEVAQCDTAQAMLAVVGTRAPAELAAVAYARLRRIARQLRQLQRRCKTLFHRQLLVVRDRFQLCAPVGILLRHLASPVVLLDRTLLRHTFTPCGSAYEGRPHCRNGKLNAVSSARASSSVRALVQTVISRPQVSVTLSKSISGKTVYSLMPRL